MSEIFSDSAFMENRDAPVHRWVPWIAGFSWTFVDSVISAYVGNRKKATILDPFAGVGTTLIQALIRGHNAIGYEINPYATLATKVKLNAFLDDKIRSFVKTIEAMRRNAYYWRNGLCPTWKAPEGFRSRIKFYSPAVEKQVLLALDFIFSIEDEHIRDLFKVAFGSVMVSFSNYSYEPSLSTRTSAGKSLIYDANVDETLLSKLQQMRDDLIWIKENVDQPGIGSIYNEDFFTAGKEIESRSIDLMITSPPYLNNYHYVRNTRPQLYWLNLITSTAEQKLLEEKNFGTFWQIARDKETVELNFEHEELEQILERLRAVNSEKGQYGGVGWANYAATYFNDCDSFLAILKRILVRRGVGVIVVGNSILQGINIPVQDIIADIAKMRGFVLDGIYLLREKRVGSSIVNSTVRNGQSETKTELEEYAVVVRKR